MVEVVGVDEGLVGGGVVNASRCRVAIVGTLSYLVVLWK
jgi:hypothetical protein